MSFDLAELRGDRIQEASMFGLFGGRREIGGERKNTKLYDKSV